MFCKIEDFQECPTNNVHDKSQRRTPRLGFESSIYLFWGRRTSVLTAQRQMPTQIHVGFCVNISAYASVWMLCIFGVKNQHLKKNITPLEAFCRLLPACLLGVRLLFPCKDRFVFKLLPGQK